ncbi:Aste57867_22007 [Aphanomyces stellatus]|uniref:Aste57867_22007 protein n=1 Tax=Aphanomyces stellatus TaxID=120398 RepID=A0A485LKE3_9STRA|nr:hypothetical protein As57867_021938 [Aphanomyces stellatus]VFT98675.1 Aste57867_22007 [Aphanomyces stellatus]
MSFDHERIVVAGISGAGKSTLAEALSKKLDLEYVDTDALLWEPNWQQAADYNEKLDEATAASKWVVAGTDRMSLERATAVVWLDYSLWTTFWRLFRRTLRRCWTQELLWGTNRESIWVQLMLWSPNSVFHWLFKFYWKKTARYPLLFAEFPHLQVYHFKTPADTDAWFRMLPHESR